MCQDGVLHSVRLSSRLDHDLEHLYLTASGPLLTVENYKPVLFHGRSPKAILAAVM